MNIGQVNAAQTPKQETGLQRCLGALEDETEQLRAGLNYLDQSLEGVLCCQGPTTMSGAFGKADSAANCPLEERLTKLLLSLRAHSEALRELRDRVQL